MYFNKFPKYIEIMEMIKPIKNKIDLAPMVIFVFLIPYVIPIPRESILLEIAKNKQLSNIKTPLSTSYEYDKKMLKNSNKNRLCEYNQKNEGQDKVCVRFEILAGEVICIIFFMISSACFIDDNF